MSLHFSFSKNFGITQSEFNALQKRACEESQELSSLGLNLIVSSDFTKLKKNWDYFQEVEGCRDIVPCFNPEFENINNDNGVWIGVYDKNNVCIGLIAARLREVMDNLYKSFSDNTFLMGDNPPLGATCSVDAQIDHIAGPVAFIGSLYVSKSWRATKVVKILVQSLIVYVYSKWKPFWQVCLISVKDLPLFFGTYGFQKIFGEVRFFDPRWKFSSRYALLGLNALEVRQRFLKIDKSVMLEKSIYQVDLNTVDGTSQQSAA